MNTKTNSSGVKKAPKTKTTADLPIVITCTILPLKGKQRPVLVSAAPQGEMPIVLKGVFQDLRNLIFQAYGQVINREPQTVTVKATKSISSQKPAAKTAAKKETTEDLAPGDEESSVDDIQEAGDQLVKDSEVNAIPMSTVTEMENLPEIENDAPFKI